MCVCERHTEKRENILKKKPFFFFLTEGMNNFKNCYFAVPQYESCLRHRSSKVKCCWRTEYVHNVPQIAYSLQFLKKKERI